MTSFHRNRNSGELVACAHDPCGLHHDDIRADTLEEAYERYNDAVSDATSYGYTDFTRMNNPYNGHGITRKAFDTQVSNVSNVINDDDWEILKSSTEDIDSIISRDYGIGGEQRRKAVADSIADYLSSDDAEPLRKYMGENIDVNDMAIMLTYHVSTMTRPAPISKSITRCILSRTGNDMNKKRYISSVLFFGGRCCYCGRILHKSTGRTGKIDDAAATAEHIDPMDGNPHGETKYGNMALCCNRCNNSKGNLSLDEWIDGNTAMNQHQKDMMISRIRDFHQYTMYEPMSMEKSREIDRIIEQARKDEEELAIHGDDGNMPPRKNGETNSQYRKRKGEFLAGNGKRKITIKKEAIAQALML